MANEEAQVVKCCVAHDRCHDVTDSWRAYTTFWDHRPRQGFLAELVTAPGGRLVSSSAAFLGPMPLAGPYPQLPTPQWPTNAWLPAAAPRPPLKVNWVVIVGAICVFFGYLLVVVSDALFVRMPQQVTYNEYVAVASIA